MAKKKTYENMNDGRTKTLNRLYLQTCQASPAKIVCELYLQTCRASPLGPAKIFCEKSEPSLSPEWPKVQLN